MPGFPVIWGIFNITHSICVYFFANTVEFNVRDFTSEQRW